MIFGFRIDIEKMFCKTYIFEIFFEKNGSFSATRWSFSTRLHLQGRVAPPGLPKVLFNAPNLQSTPPNPCVRITVNASKWFERVQHIADLDDDWPMIADDRPMIGDDWPMIAHDWPMIGRWLQRHCWWLVDDCWWLTVDCWWLAYDCWWLADRSVTDITHQTDIRQTHARTSFIWPINSLSRPLHNRPLRGNNLFL